MGKLRRICQWGAIAILIVLPMISRGGALHQSFGPGASHVDSLASPWEAFLYHAFSKLFGAFEEPAAVADLFQGSYWSITLFGVTISDPLALLGHALAGGSIHWPLAAGVLTPVFLAVFAGRAFCGWVCPVNTILELIAKLRRWLERRVVRRRLPDWTPPLRFRYLLLAAGILISAAAGIGAFALMLPYNAVARDWHLAVYGAGFGFGVLFLVVLMALELLVAPRLWCRSLCPTGLVLGLLGKRRMLGIKRKRETQCPSGCSLCVTTCPVGVIPKDEINTEECLICNECVVSCPEDLLTIGRSANRPAPWRAAVRPAVRPAVIGVLVLLGSSVPGPAVAHHVKGMPHYGYLENYPQTPTFEKHIPAPPYEITLVTYLMEGLVREKSETPNDAMIYVSIQNRETGKPYTGKLELTFKPSGQSSGDGAPGDGTTTRRFRAPLEETVYRTRVSLPAAAYDIDFRILGAPALGAPALGEPPAQASLHLSLRAGVNWWLMASAAVGFATLAGLGAAMLRRRRHVQQHVAAHRQ